MTDPLPAPPAAGPAAGPAPGRRWGRAVLRPGWAPLAALLTASGVLHFLTPGPFRRIVPPALGDPGLWVAASGVAELGVAAGLCLPRTRRTAGWAAAALFVAVFPANIYMALDSSWSPAVRRVAWARLPLQVPLVLWGLRVGRTGPREHTHR